MYKYTKGKLPLFKTMSNLLLYHMLFGSNILGGKSIFSYLFKKMAHKKTILNKFQVESDSSDYRSPRHDCQNWYISETSFSEDIKNTNTSEEDPDVYSNHSTSSQGNSKQITSQNECKISSRIPIQPPKKRDVYPETNSSGSWKYFNTDDSPISGLESKKNSSSSCATVPFLGTTIYPITATSSSQSSENTRGFNTGNSGKSTEAFSPKQTKEESDDTIIIVTSTPVKSDAPLSEDQIWKLVQGTLSNYLQKYLDHPPIMKKKKQISQIYIHHQVK